ncbi:MAG: hypothetical protein H6993_19245 [Pseudomonadales bacterium]|nr:hypothetical protein [Pseudomonadales bacterium]
MSVERRRAAIVLGIIQDLAASGRTRVRPGDVIALLRERGMPMGAWEVRAELSGLEAAGMIVLDVASAEWMLTEGGAAAKHTDP